MDATKAAEIRAKILEENDFDEEWAVYRGFSKFVGEPIYSPYFYEQSMIGSGEPIYAPCDEHADSEDGCDCETLFVGDLLDVTDEDREVFPEIGADTTHVVVHVSDTGFVSVWEFDHDPTDELTGIETVAHETASGGE